METAKGKTREETITRLAERIDRFEKYSQSHARVMAELSARLARRLGLGQSDINSIAEAAFLHDIGLYAMNPAYHASPGPLSFDERMDLWRHSIIGEQQMAKRDATRHAQLLVRWHHEWWNGSGYPDMLAFEDIPIGARILRAVELYSALTSDRPYRKALAEDQALATLAASAGIECDPYVVKALLALLDDLREAAKSEAAKNEATTSEVAPAREPEIEQPLRDAEADTWVAGHSPAARSSASDPEQQIDNQSSFDNQNPLDSQNPLDDLNPLDNQSSFDNLPRTIEAEPPSAQSSEFQSAPSSTDQAQEPVLEDEHQRASDQPKPPEPEDHERGLRHPSRSGEQVSLPSIETLGSVESLISRAKAKDSEAEDTAEWREWAGTKYNERSLFGFEASVLRQIEFRSIAIPLCGRARLDWYLKIWGKLVLSNDPRAWAAASARAMVEARNHLDEEQISRLLEDIYVPGVKLSNPHLRQWFSEMDSWWMDNLRRNVERLEDETMRAHALVLGMQTGDYALSFTEATRELRRPLTTIFWRLAGRTPAGAKGHPHNRSYNQPADEFIKRARADLLYLTLPPAHSEMAGDEARSQWREAWVRGADGQTGDELLSLMTAPQSKRAYLAMADRLLGAAAHIKTWAIGYQEVGLVSARDISELIKEHRPVQATYSKDLTEVAGGLRSYIIVAEKDRAR